MMKQLIKGVSRLLGIKRHNCSCCSSAWSDAFKVADGFKLECHMSQNFNVLKVCTESLKRDIKG